MSPKVFLVTGSSTGLGRALVEAILAKGDIAVATLRKPAVLDELAKKYSSDKLLVLPLDVTKPSEVTAAFAKVKEVFGRLGVVISNAGVSLLSEVEGCSDAVARSMFEINFWGHIEVSKQAVAFFRDVNKPGQGGHLLAISSVVGIMSYPGSAHYSASKHAVEAITEGLAKEVDPAWNIKITIVEPGQFKTDILDNSPVEPAHPAYTNPALPSIQLRTAIKEMFSTSGSDPVKGAQAILKVVEMEQPPLRFPLGADAYQWIEAHLDEFKKTLVEYKTLGSDTK